MPCVSSSSLGIVLLFWSEEPWRPVVRPASVNERGLGAPGAHECELQYKSQLHTTPDSRVTSARSLTVWPLRGLLTRFSPRGMVLDSLRAGATQRLLRKTFFLFWGKSKLKGDENRTLLLPALYIVPAACHCWGKRHKDIPKPLRRPRMAMVAGRLCVGVPCHTLARGSYLWGWVCVRMSVGDLVPLCTERAFLFKGLLYNSHSCRINHL